MFLVQLLVVQSEWWRGHLVASFTQGIVASIGTLCLMGSHVVPAKVFAMKVLKVVSLLQLNNPILLNLNWDSIVGKIASNFRLESPTRWENTNVWILHQ